MSTAQDPGDWLRELMERRHLSTRQVADAVGLRDQAVYYWITGRTAPKDEAAAKLAALLDVPEVELRRRFGLWVPDTEPAEPQYDADELRELREQLSAIIAKIEEIQRRRG